MDETAIRAEIREQLAGDERFLRVALGIHERHPDLGTEDALALVMDECRKGVQGAWTR